MTLFRKSTLFRARFAEREADLRIHELERNPGNPAPLPTSIIRGGPFFTT